MKINLVFLGVSISFFILALLGGFLLLWPLFFLSVVLLLFGFVWVFFSVRGLAVQSFATSANFQVGECVEQNITLFNNSRLPEVLVRLKQNTNLPGKHEVKNVAIPARGYAQLTTKVPCLHRGYYSIGQLNATVKDIFGVASIQKSFGEPKHVIVLPATVELPLLTPVLKDDSLTRTSKWQGNGISSNASRVREYVSGDGYNRIHWRSTAHTGHPMVKIFDPESKSIKSKSIWIMADMQKEAHSGNSAHATEEYCVTITASLVKKYITSGIAAGLIMAGDQSCTILPDTGEQHLEKIMESLALVKATGDIPLAQLINDRINYLGTEATIIVVTTLFDSKTRSSLRSLTGRGNNVIVILVDARSFGGSISTITTENSVFSEDIQVYVVRYGEDLALSLSTQSAFFSLEER